MGKDISLRFFTSKKQMPWEIEQYRHVTNLDISFTAYFVNKPLWFIKYSHDAYPTLKKYNYLYKQKTRS